MLWPCCVRQALLVTDELTKVDPVSGAQQHGDERYSAVWDGAAGVARVSAARGEHAALQMFISAAAPNASLRGVRTVAGGFTGPAGAAPPRALILYSVSHYSGVEVEV